jgi:excisionase family DNA binding protein
VVAVSEAAARSPYFLVEEVAERLRCSVRSVHELTRLGEIPHRKLPGSRRCLFLEAELERWEAGARLERFELIRGGRIVRPAEPPGSRETLIESGVSRARNHDVHD